METRSIFESEDRYRTIVQLAPDIVYTLTPDGIITSLSDSFEKITGWKNKEWVGKHFASIVYNQDLPVAAKVISKALKGKDIKKFQVRILAKNGKLLEFDVSITQDVVSGKTVGLIGIARDMTNQRRIDAEHLHYANLIKSADAAIISRDLNGKILTWNHAAEAFFGYKASEVIGRDFTIIVPSDKIKEFRRNDKKVRSGKLIEDYETVRITKSGIRVDILAKNSPIRDRNGKIIGISVFDRENTARIRTKKQDKFLTQASKTLSSSLNYKATLKRVAKIMVPEIADWSSVHILENGRLEQLTVAHKDKDMVKKVLEFQKKMAREANEQASRERLEKLMTGKTEFYPHITEEMLDKLVKRKEDRRLLKEIGGLISAITVPIVSGRKMLGSITLATRDKIYDQNDVKLAEELGRRAGNAIVNAKLYFEAQEEIGKRKKAEERVKRSRDELNIVFKNIADGITVMDGEGKLKYVNDAVAYASGYASAQEMLKNPAQWAQTFELKAEDGEEFPIENLPSRRALRGELSPSEIVGYKNRKTGEEKWSLVKARPVFDKFGHVTTVVSVTSDITQNKELERRKDDFVSIASHELKTPLTSIKGFVHLLKKEHQDEAKSFRYLSRVDEQLIKLNELIRDLLDLTRIQSGKLVYHLDEFTLGKLVRETVDDLRKTAGKHKIHLKNGIKGKVVGDRDRVSQVLINLLSNAIKYSPESDTIDVAATEDKKRITVCIRDYGIGIKKEEKEKIFDRFYRVDDTNDKTFPGLGIGLYISREIIARHRGKIWVESKKGQGSAFYFSLPRAS